MNAQQIAKYQQIRARIVNFQKPVIVRPLSAFDRAVLSIQYPASVLAKAH